MDAWLQRHPDYAVKIGKRISNVKVEAMKPSELRAFFQRFQQHVSDSSTGTKLFHPSLLVNCDESMLLQHPTKNSVKVVCLRNFTNPFTQYNQYRSHSTLHLAATATGALLPPLMIYQNLAHLPQEVAELTLSLFHSWSFASTTSGWQTQPSFANWVERILIPYVQQQRAALSKVHPTKQFPALIITDQHYTRTDSTAMLRKLQDLEIHVLLLPVNTTMLLQPLD